MYGQPGAAKDGQQESPAGDAAADKKADGKKEEKKVEEGEVVG